MITPTVVSSRAFSSASETSISVSGRNALCTSGRLIVIFAMPSPDSSYGCLRTRRRRSSPRRWSLASLAPWSPAVTRRARHARGRGRRRSAHLWRVAGPRGRRRGGVAGRLAGGDRAPAGPRVRGGAARLPAGGRRGGARRPARACPARGRRRDHDRRAAERRARARGDRARSRCATPPIVASHARRPSSGSAPCTRRERPGCRGRSR